MTGRTGVAWRAARGLAWWAGLALCATGSLGAGLAAPPAGAAISRPPPIALQRIAPGVWWVAGAAGDADAANRGAISNLIIVADGARTWALGSGPSAVYGRTLAAQVRRSTGRRLTDVIAPWTRPELVLGAAGMPRVRLWAHADVAAAMAARCPGCIDRLAQRLGPAAADLGTRQAPVPRQLVHGEQGRLGPWHWWRVTRSRPDPGTVPGPAQQVTVWHLANTGLWAAPGLLWADGAPDLRDSRVADMAVAVERLQALASTTPGSGPGQDAAPRWLPEQGPPAGPHLLLQHAVYWAALSAAAAAAWGRGDAETAPAPALPDVPQAWLASPRHALNWQRAWREAEARAFDVAPPQAPALADRARNEAAPAAGR
ncbi:MAG: hypothetical protein RLZZ584_2159 [Pseudomonadota bacterium]